jgi:hypothetical protein
LNDAFKIEERLNFTEERTKSASWFSQLFVGNLGVWFNGSQLFQGVQSFLKKPLALDFVFQIMALELEALVFQQGSYSYGCSDIYVLGGGGSYCLGLEEDKVCFETPHNYSLESSSSSLMVQAASVKERGTSTATNIGLLGQGLISSVEAPAATMGRLKRRRTRSTKNKEEKENQRMTHIAVERNRRKQMNDYLAVLRSMMPPSYVQKVLFLAISFSSLIK